MNTLLRFGITCTLLLSTPAVLVWAQTNDTVNSSSLQSKNTSQNRYGSGLGRLLTTENERNKIDDLRFNVAEPAKATKEELVDESPKLLSIEGVTYRPDRPAGQRINIWISGRVYSENELPYGLSIVRNAKGDYSLRSCARAVLCWRSSPSSPPGPRPGLMDF